MSSGRPGGIRTRTSPLIPGAPSGHAYSESHGAERYNSRSSRTLSKTSHSSHGRGKLHGFSPGLSNPRCRMWYFTCRPLYLPPYPTDAPFGIRHLLRTAQPGLEAKLYPLPLKAGRVCRFPPRDVCSKIEITCKNGFWRTLGKSKPNDHHFCTNAGAVLFRKRPPRFPFLSIKPLFSLSLIL